ncbi:hypothetical protein [Algoriphagus hitonicola]|uniref:Uncharacterized protein n=1 Tax=Algoriphagus hitonicola TaxID=435880 RepID=A0A1I2X5Z3_9BACT|nr:hypothetical protein [Algoriphagus hitonicola]SFH08950.1 hypothetical protein SAMN04487988_11666 [Algoriphagus hitonicola]
MSTPLSNLQKELLKVFSHQLSEEELLDVKELLVKYFSEKAISKADRIWEKEKWDDKKLDQILRESARTPYHK